MPLFATAYSPDPTMQPARLRSRRARRTCHCDAVLGGSDDRPRPPPRPEKRKVTGQAGAVRLPVPSTPTRPARPKTDQPGHAGRGNRAASSKRPNAEHAAVRIDPGRGNVTPRGYPLRPQSGADSLRWSSPSLLVSSGQGVARTSREPDRDERVAGLTVRSITLRNGACPFQADSCQPTSTFVTSVPKSKSGRHASNAERTDRHQQPGGSCTTAHPHTHWQICTSNLHAGRTRSAGASRIGGTGSPPSP